MSDTDPTTGRRIYQPGDLVFVTVNRYTRRGIVVSDDGGRTVVVRLGSASGGQPFNAHAVRGRTWADRGRRG